MKTTLKDIKEFAKRFYVEDVTYYSVEKLEEILKLEGCMHKVCYAEDRDHTLVGCVLQGSASNKLYVIASRTKAFYILL